MPAKNLSKTEPVFPLIIEKPEDRYSVSYSETSSYLLCKRKHYYGYTRSLKRVTESDSLMLGSAGHKVLDAFYSVILDAGDDLKEQQDAFDTALSKAHDKYNELIREGFRDSDKKVPLDVILFENYFPFEPFVKEGWRILAVEKEFVLRIEDEPVQTPFVVDLIAVDPYGKVTVIDHKFVYDFITMEQSELQPQIPLYIAALRGLGFKIDAGGYNMLRNRRMKAPVPSEMAQYLPLKPNSTRVLRTFQEQISVAKEIQAIKSLSPDEQDMRAHRVANRMVCQSCSFIDLCKTELNGGNTKLMIATEYSIRERRSFSEVGVIEDA